MKKVLIGEDVKRTLMVVAASVFSAWNINTFVHAAGLLPGGLTGLSLLLQECFAAFLHLAVPYSAINVILNCIPAAISFKFIGKKFTGFSVLSIVLTGLLVDMLPSAPVTDEVLLNAIFGGIIEWSVHYHLPESRRHYGRNRFYFHFPVGTIWD